MLGYSDGLGLCTRLTLGGLIAHVRLAARNEVGLFPSEIVKITRSEEFTRTSLSANLFFYKFPVDYIFLGSFYGVKIMMRCGYLY